MRVTKVAIALLALAASVANAQWFRPTSVRDKQVGYSGYGCTNAYDAFTSLDNWVRYTELNPLNLSTLPAEVRALVDLTVSNQVVQSASGIFFSGDRVRIASLSGDSLLTNAYPGTLFSTNSITGDLFQDEIWWSWESLIPKYTFLDRHFEDDSFMNTNMYPYGVNGDMIAMGSVTVDKLGSDVLEGFGAASAVTGEIKMFIFPPQATNSMNGGVVDPTYMRGWVVCDGKWVPRGPLLNNGDTNLLADLANVLGTSYGYTSNAVLPSATSQVVYYGNSSLPVNGVYVRLPDFSNRFIRGLDSGVGLDSSPARALGSIIGPTIEEHKHRSFYFGPTADLGLGAGVDLRGANGNNPTDGGRALSAASMVPSFGSSLALWANSMYYQNPASITLGNEPGRDKTGGSWTFTSYAESQPISSRNVANGSAVVEPPKVPIYFCIATGAF